MKKIDPKLAREMDKHYTIIASWVLHCEAHRRQVIQGREDDAFTTYRIEFSEFLRQYEKL